jgi:hypothetical protein
MIKSLPVKYVILGIVLLLLSGAVWKLTKIDHERQSIALSTDKLETVEHLETNWPQLRGPTFDSISTDTGLADSWPPDGPPVLWTREIGQGYSGFVAVGKRVFTQSQSLYQQSVICLDSQSGQTVWTYNCGWPYEGGGLYPGPRSTPTWNNGRLFYASPDGTIGCLDAETGGPIWSTNPKRAYHGRGTDFGYACSPVIVGSRVIVPVGAIDASVVALDARDGTLIWKSGDSSASYATPLPIQWRGRSLVVTPLENSIAAFDVTSGKKEWEFELSQGYDEHSACPIYQQPFLLIASPFRAGAERYRLVAEIPDSPGENDQKSGSGGQVVSINGESINPVITWKSQNLSNDVASSVLVDGRIYGFDLKDPQSRLDRPSRGEFRCLDFESGRVIWSTDQVGQANAIVADQKLIMFTDRGELILARLGTDEYSELARTQVFHDEICWTYPALHQECLYLRTQARAACLYLGKAPYGGRQPVHSVQSIPRGRALDAKWMIGGEREYPATVPDWSEFFVWYKWSMAALLFASVLAQLVMFVIRGYWYVMQRQVPDRRPASIALVKRTDDSRSTASSAEPSVLKDSSVDPFGAAIRIRRIAFWVTATLVAVIGSPFINHWQEQYVLLWPFALWIAFQMTINVITWAERHADRRSARWLSRGCGIVFIAICALYFHLCRSAGYAIEWSFLVGLLPGFPIAILAARFLTMRPRFWIVTDLVFSVLSSSACFWFSVIFIKWKLVVGS